MSGPSTGGGEPITDKRQLVDYLAAGSKPPEKWRLGTEHEKFPFRLTDHSPVAYDGPDGIRALLSGLQRFGWQPVEENGNLIALLRDKCSITLEPGGQFELSGAPLQNVHQTCSEVGQHLREVRTVCDELGIGMLGMGFTPDWRRDQVPWMPKGRYAIMRRQMARRGTRGHDMMLRTCTVQTNLDFASEADMVTKFRVSLALQPVATALFANSPFEHGQPSGLLSLRSWVWTDTDPDRTGDLPFVFEPGMGFERYIDYALDVPMYFVYRDGQYIDAAGLSFRDFMAGRLEVLPGEIPAIGDFADHLTTIFPEVRLKQYLEMRGADGGPWSRLCALPALWVGLLYDDQALAEAAELIRDWTAEERWTLRLQVPHTGLKTRFRQGTVQDLALRVLAIARAGLGRRAQLDHVGGDESPFLNALHDIAESGETPAERTLALYHGPWQGSVDRCYAECAY